MANYEVNLPTTSVWYEFCRCGTENFFNTCHLILSLIGIIDFNTFHLILLLFGDRRSTDDVTPKPQKCDGKWQIENRAAKPSYTTTGNGYKIKSSHTCIQKTDFIYDDSFSKKGDILFLTLIGNNLSHYVHVFYQYPHLLTLHGIHKNIPAKKFGNQLIISK